MATARSSFQAQVTLQTGLAEPGLQTSHVVVRHHRAPAVAWSVDRATGGHMLHLALAQCVFNNVVRIAQERGVTCSDVRVVADGDFNADGTASTGIDCSIDVSGTGGRSELASIATDAFNDSSVVAVLRRGGPVELTSVRVTPRPEREPSTE